jgi:2-oxoglutarate/2-oxoacid ferredoxin oxidoreductase subunit beta
MSMTDIAEPRPAPACALAAHDFRSSAQPIWCPGCGHYGVLGALEDALAQHGRPPHEVAIISGIGCSSRLPAYTSCYGFHGVHGRGLAFATGLKLARPDLVVVSVGGDGDGYSIGGNHFLHACRRNVDMTYIVMDNRVYGMTKAQPSPTTEADWDSDIAPGGVGLRPFNPLAVAIASGATFVARSFSYDPQATAKLILEGIRWPGFAFIEVMSPCVTWRPEEFDWKADMHAFGPTIDNDRAAAVAKVLTDDGFGLGLIFKGEPRPLPKSTPSPATLADIERQFAIGG